MSAEGLRLNLGCGEQQPEGWLNLDSSPGARLAQRPLLFKLAGLVVPSRLMPAKSWLGAPVRYMDLTRPWPLEGGSASAVYSSHFLEHLMQPEAEFVLRESARVLRAGGRIRILVPDLEAIVEQYGRDREERPAAAAASFLRNTGFFDQPPPQSLRQYFVYRVRHRHNHRFLHDEAALRSQLEAAGFREVERRGCGDSGIPDIGSVDWPDRFESSLCLEGVKP